MQKRKFLVNSAALLCATALVLNKWDVNDTDVDDARARVAQKLRLRPRVLTASAQAVLSTHSPIGMMSPVSSASGMKSPGGIVPCSGRCQRIRASTLRISPELRSTHGW